MIIIHSLPHALITFIFTCIFIKQTVQQSVDSFATYYTGSATAMDMHYASNQVVFANGNRQIVHYSTTPGPVKITISTTHKAKIGTLAISPDKTKVISGGYDYTARAYNLATGNLLCTFDQLRGNIISSKIGSDNDFYAFGSNEGYLYYGFISNCTKNVYNRTDYVLKSLDIIMGRNQIWVADGTAGFFVFNYNTTIMTPYSLPTDNSNSISDLSALSVLGLCTSRAFYLINYTGIVKFTLTHPTLYTLNCRIAPEWTGNQSGVYYLTATSERTNYTLGSVIYPIWNIWKVDVGNLKATLYLEQRNTGSRYGSTGVPVNDAAAYLVTSKSIYVTSIANGYSPYSNSYFDTMPTNSGISKCTNGFYSTSISVPCQKCNWDDGTRAFCATCNTSSNVCNQCTAYTYLIGSNNTCGTCPANCYFCSSASVCVVCFGGFTLIGSNCLNSNLTGCINSFWNSSSQGGVSQCSSCAKGYFSQFGLICKACDMIFANCSICDKDTCFQCHPNFVLLNPTAPNICESCSYFIEGCAACLNQSYCDTCFEWYPYFHNPSSTQRICKRTCYFECYDCQHLQYKTCTGCDPNRTLINNTCYCKPEFPINDTTNLRCQQCRDYLKYCINCTSTTFCVQCDPGYFFNDLNSTHQYCKTCNYTCLTCGTKWYQCATCDATLHRKLNTVTSRCDCQSNRYFERGNQTACQFCGDAISSCEVCFNQTFCITCISGYFVNTVSPGNKLCAACTPPCTQCFGLATNCSDCYSGRQLNSTTRTCDCLPGYYPTGATSCDPCYPLLGACAKCNNDTTCLQCWPNNFFFVDTDGKKKCGLCKRTCMTCSTSANVCGTCDSLANRVLNPVTFECDCMVGYVQTDGRCLNCSATFQYCISCNATVCFACQPGFSLAFGGLKCVDCATTYPGCINCLNGVCVACNQTEGYEIAYSKCICKPGRYFKALKCPAYVMGPTIQRLFPAYPTYSQDMNTDQITIRIYFQCQRIKVPYGITNSIRLTINSQSVTSYSVLQSNTTFQFKFTPQKDIGRASIILQFFNNTIFDKDQYGPLQRVFLFSKNVFVKAKYELSQNFAVFYFKYIIPGVRWICTIFILLGSADYVMILVFTVHFLPAFVLLNLTPPLPLYNTLLSLAKINSKSLFTFADINVNYENYENYANLIETYGITGGLVNEKIMDLVFLGCLLGFYGILCPLLTRFVPEGTMSRFWNYKFHLKRYSTLTNIVLCFLPSFQFCAIMDFRMQRFNPTSYVTLSISLLMLAFSCIYIFIHSLILYLTQFNDQYKNQDCYFASSILQPRSITYVLSLLMMSIWSIPMLGFFNGAVGTSAIIVIMLWHILHYRFWDNFPNKVLYFIKLFYSLFILFFALSFLIFQIGQKYFVLEVASITLVGLICLVFILLIFSFACLETLILLVTTVYKACKQSTSLVQNIQQQKQKQLHPQQNSSQQAQSVYNMRIKLAAERALQQQAMKAKLTNKEQHMKMFRQQHLQTVGDRMYLQSNTQQSFRTTSMSNSKKRR